MQASYVEAAMEPAHSEIAARTKTPSGVRFPACKADAQVGAQGDR